MYWLKTWARPPVFRSWLWPLCVNLGQITYLLVTQCPHLQNEDSNSFLLTGFFGGWNELICGKYKVLSHCHLFLPLLQVRKLKFEELCPGSSSQEFVDLRWRGKRWRTIRLGWADSSGECHPQIGTCHLPLQESNHEPLQLLTFNTPWKEFRVEIRN